MSEVIQCADTTEAIICPFCDPTPPRDLSIPIDIEGKTLLTPDHGMLIPGHMLAITSDHLTSFAQLEGENLSLIDEHLSSLEETLAPEFGRYFRLEHGSDNLTAHGSGGCIDHAHIHLIPADEDAGPYIQEQLPWQELDEYDDLAEFRDAPYIYLGRLAAHYVVPDPRLPGQWVRRQVAAVRQLEEWDWAVMDSSDEKRITAEKINSLDLGTLLNERLD